MPSTDIQLTWVQRVRPDELGGHLEAYINLLPTITSLRMCNRFGKGDQAYVTRLPVEIVSHIEELMTEHERDQVSLNWILAHGCWVGLCDPTSHYNDEESVKLYNDLLVDEDDDDDEPAIDRLSDDQEESLNEILADSGSMAFGEVLPGLDGWRDIHDSIRGGWEKHTGELGSNDRGIFTKHQDLMRKHFGLDVWISHVVHKGNFYDEDFLMSTVAYLTLPTPPKVRKPLPQRIAGMECTVKLPTETSYEFAVTPPPQPSEKSLARFARAVKILGLEVMPLTDKRELLADSDEESGSDEKEMLCCGGHGSDTGPALRLLVANKDDSPPDEI